MKKLLLSIFAIEILFVLAFLITYQINSSEFDKKQFIDIANNYSVKIDRDIFGVPHIDGERDIDAAFGFGYAQTDDDLYHVEMMIKMARGELSDFNFSFSSLSLLYSLITGEEVSIENINTIEGVELDFLIKFLNTEGIVDKKFETIPPQTIDYLQGYADGVNYWAAMHPNKVDQSLYPVTARDFVVGMTFRMPLFYGFDHGIKQILELMQNDNQTEVVIDPNSLSSNKLVAKVKSHFHPAGSNAFAVSKSRSAENLTMLSINSHQPLTGPVAWYEIHLKSNEGLNIMGGTFPGSPFVHVGFNEHLGWGATVNQPDLTDIYELTLNPDNNNQYLLDDNWVDFEVIKQTFKVKLFGPFYIKYPIDMFFSKHGPVLKDDSRAFALRYVGMDDVDHSTSWLRLNKASNFSEWKSALEMQQLASLNLIYADKDDNIFFVHNVKSPIRNADYDWTKVIPGDKSELIWNDFHPFDSIPQILNPQSGYLFSTNQNPFYVTAPEDNLVIEDFPDTMGFQTRTTNRAYRSFELFENLPLISYQELKDIKYDNKFSSNSRQYKFMKEIFEYDFSNNERFKKAQEFLKDWDLGTNSENMHAAFGVCILSPEWLAEIQREQRPDPIQIFKDCVDEFFTNFGKLDIAWSNVNFLKRDEKMVHIQGGPDVLRAIYAPRSEDGILKAVAGDGLYIFVHWNDDKDMISESIHQFGSATMNSYSKHYDDQMSLFANEQLKNTYYSAHDLKNNLESTLKIN